LDIRLNLLTLSLAEDEQVQWITTHNTEIRTYY